MCFQREMTSGQEPKEGGNKIGAEIRARGSKASQS